MEEGRAGSFFKYPYTMFQIWSSTHFFSKFKICETCPGAQLLVYVKHSPQYGKCVDTCSEGQVPDYETNLVQARCVLREERCGLGYYLNSIGKCDQCDQACATCHGPGSLGCDTCAVGYGNRSTGYCRQCCGEGQQQSQTYRCVVVIVSLFGTVGYCLFRDDRSQIDYTPLPHYNSHTEEVHILDSDSDNEEDPVFDAKRMEI
ncbi:unnamed protein product [Strongylus vulgaris]|uniref:Uncharacterized protein n=1 Tax=Strongylus vulgaris TaxID=40348 RepID=A0A3P7IQJ5_STRVU|nr:unnamed protein product [Strongylus vulgaris]